MRRLVRGNTFALDRPTKGRRPLGLAPLRFGGESGPTKPVATIDSGPRVTPEPSERVLYPVAAAIVGRWPDWLGFPIRLGGSATVFSTIQAPLMDSLTAAWANFVPLSEGEAHEQRGRIR